jgi:hypothetical protein
VAQAHAPQRRDDALALTGSSLARYADCLASADSLAWSFEARRAAPLPGCSHASCANCSRYATAWRERVLRRLEVVQMRLRVAE